MLRRDVVSIFVLEDSSVMRIGILLTGMFGFTNTMQINVRCLYGLNKSLWLTHAMIAVVAPAGTSAFSIAFANFCCTSVARL
jgi:hypothetical protein